MPELVKNKTALITGIRGQDGAYLARHLLKRGYVVFGADRRSGSADSWKMRELGIDPGEVDIKYMDLLEEENIRTVLGEVDPDLIFNLAAQSFVQVSFDQPILTNAVNGMGVVRLLTVVRALQLVRQMVGGHVRFYQAGTSEMFGGGEGAANEDTLFHPRSPYAVAKAHAHYAVQQYRETYQTWACNGILFNHESPLRSEEFVTRKITKAVAQFVVGDRTDPLELGNLDARRDWGHAKDYTEAMVRILEHERPDDYVIATGETHSVRDFVVAAFGAAGIQLLWTGEGVDEVAVGTGDSYPDLYDAVLVKINPQFYRPQEVGVLVGNPSKAKSVLDWDPTVTFQELVTEMVEADIRREK